MHELIALTVGVPSAILAAIVVWYAKRNDAFQKIMSWKKDHHVDSGHVIHHDTAVKNDH